MKTELPVIGIAAGANGSVFYLQISVFEKNKNHPGLFPAKNQVSGSQRFSRDGTLFGKNF